MCTETENSNSSMSNFLREDYRSIILWIISIFLSLIGLVPSILGEQNLFRHFDLAIIISVYLIQGLANIINNIPNQKENLPKRLHEKSILIFASVFVAFFLLLLVTACGEINQLKSGIFWTFCLVAFCLSFFTLYSQRRLLTKDLSNPVDPGTKMLREEKKASIAAILSKQKESRVDM